MSEQARRALAEPAPVASRIDALDALRGLSVLGILVINIIGLSLPEIAFFNPRAAGGEGVVNFGLWTFTTVFIEGAMRGLFSVMFGAGVVLFTARAAFPDGPIKIADLYYRRTLWLIVFGIIHAFALLMPGDILLLYGLAGLALFPFRILPPRKLAALAALFLAGFMVLYFDSESAQTELGLEAAALEANAASGDNLNEAQQEVVDEWREQLAGNWPSQEDLEVQIKARTGSPAEVYGSNTEIVVGYSDTGGLLWFTADAFMMMLLGMALFKWGVLSAQRSPRFYAGLMLAGYAVGLSLRIWGVWERWEGDFSPIIMWPWVFDQPSRVAMTLGHIGLFFTCWKFSAASLALRALTATGRMALTNYIGQTVIANLIFTGIGFGLYGALDRTGIYSIMLAIWLVQLVFSLWWLSRFRFGPLEWVWRCLTYGRRQPLRKRAN